MTTPLFVNSGIRSGWLHGTASQERIEAGDLVVVDVVPRYMVYRANLTRTFVRGEVTPKLRDMLNTYRQPRRPGSPHSRVKGCGSKMARYAD